MTTPTPGALVESRTAARRRFKAAQDANDAAYVEQVNAHVEGARLAGRVAFVNERVRAALELHLPAEATDHYLSVYCPACAASCCESADYPCETVTTLLPGLPPMPKKVYARFEDFWEEPHVTVTLAHPIKVPFPDGTGAIHYEAGATVTMPVTAAERVRTAVLTTDYEAIVRPLL